MRTYVLALLLLVSVPAFAKDMLVAVSGDEAIVITDKKCTSKVADAAKPEFKDQLLNARYVWKDDKHPAVHGCALPLPAQGVVLTAFEDGDQLPLPMNAFVPVEGDKFVFGTGI